MAEVDLGDLATMSVTVHRLLEGEGPVRTPGIVVCQPREVSPDDSARSRQVRSLR